MKLSEFKAKAMPGLYSFDHYEASNGAFIQVSARGDTFIYQDEQGERKRFATLDALEDALKGGE